MAFFCLLDRRKRHISEQNMWRGNLWINTPWHHHLLSRRKGLFPKAARNRGWAKSGRPSTPQVFTLDIFLSWSHFLNLTIMAIVGFVFVFKMLEACFLIYILRENRISVSWRQLIWDSPRVHVPRFSLYSVESNSLIARGRWDCRSIMPEAPSIWLNTWFPPMFPLHLPSNGFSCPPPSYGLLCALLTCMSPVAAVNSDEARRESLFCPDELDSLFSYFDTSSKLRSSKYCCGAFRVCAGGHCAVWPFL